MNPILPSSQEVLVLLAQAVKYLEENPQVHNPNDFRVCLFGIVSKIYLTGKPSTSENLDSTAAKHLSSLGIKNFFQLVANIHRVDSSFREIYYIEDTQKAIAAAKQLLKSRGNY